MKWAVAVPYMKMSAIQYGVYAPLKFTCGLPRCYITVVNAPTEAIALQIGIELAALHVDGAELYPHNASAITIQPEVPITIQHSEIIEE